MEKKIIEMNQAFQHLRFHDCLVIIDQLLKKYTKPDKKNKCLTQYQLILVKYFKAGSLVSIGKFHQANFILSQISDPESVKMLGAQQTYLLTSISQLFGDGRQSKMIQLLQKNAPNHKKNALYRFQLTTRNFSTLSKHFFKEYMDTKNVVYQFCQVYLEYLQQLEKLEMIEYQRDGWYKYNQKMKMGMIIVKKFLDKAVENVVASFVKCEQEIKQIQEWKDKRKIQEKEKEKEKQEIKEKDEQKKEIVSEGKDKDKERKEKEIETNKQIELKHKNDKKTSLQKDLKVLKKLKQKSKQLQLRILINQGKVLDSIKLFIDLRNTLKFPFTFIRSILKLKQVAEKPQIVEWFYVDEMELIFRTNLDFNHYTPWYDYYNQFLQIILKRIEDSDKQYKKSVDLSQVKIDFDLLYKFSSKDPKEILQIYHKSLYSEYNNLTNKQDENYQKNKKSDYYKICIKGLLLQLIKINHIFSQQANMLKYLKDFQVFFGNTLTYAHQMREHWNLLVQKGVVKKMEVVENDNQLIQEINFYKISIGVKTTEPSYEEFINIYTELNKLYHERVKTIEKNRKLQKGERYISDQFYTLICDYARAYIETQTSSEPIFKILSFLMPQLEQIIEVSPYNADTKLRLIHFCMLLNHGQKLLDVYFTNDIKSVQWESLGYWFLRVLIEVGIGETHDHQLDKFIKSYQDNARQTSEYGLKALKAGEFQRVDEYLCYRTCMQNSYNSIIMLYSLFHYFRFHQHSQFYLLQISSKLNKFKKEQNKLYFNADYKIMKNELFNRYSFVDFYGIFNSYQILEQDVQICLHQYVLGQKIMGKQCQNVNNELMELKKVEENVMSNEVAKVFDLKKYTFQQGSPLFNINQSKYTVKRNQVFLKFFILVSQIRISTILLTTQLHNFTKNNEVNKQLLEQLKERMLKASKKMGALYEETEYRFQIHTITMIRRGLFESYNLLSLLKELVKKNKKIKFAKQTVNSLADPIMEYLLEMIVGLKFSKRSHCQQSHLQEREELLERSLTIDMNQAKRIISKYQGVSKW